MSTSRLAFVSLIALALAAPAAADDSGNFVVRLGQDTVGVEHYQRSKDRTEVDQVGRAPRVLQRHFVYEYAKNNLSKFSMVVTPPGSTTPTQTVEATNGADSLRMKIQSGAAPANNVAIALPPGTLVIASSSPWSGYESKTMELAKGKKDTLRCPLYLLGAPSVNNLVLSKLGKDSVVIWNDHLDVFHARVDKDGRLLSVVPISGTGKFSAMRVEKLDLAGLTASFAAEDKSGAGVGMLSPRDTVQVNTAGATLWIDYSRPGKRGRVIYGSVVPYGEVWRTGANAATQFKTDKALIFGGTVVPAGFYTLWTLPTAGGWKLIINSETGQWGTAHNPAKDLFTIDMTVGALPQAAERFTISVDPSAQGGTLNLDWDTTRASAAFVVQP